MRIALGADHRGADASRAIEALLIQEGHHVQVLGVCNSRTCDYPDMAYPVANAVAEGVVDFGILVDGTGIGMSIAANKLPGVRAAAVHDEIGADISRRHTDANVLCLPADMLGLRIIERIVRTFLTTEFESGRHARRVAKIAAIEKGRDPTKLETEPPVPEAR